jgi:hypothetical protein
MGDSSSCVVYVDDIEKVGPEIIEPIYDYIKSKCLLVKKSHLQRNGSLILFHLFHLEFQSLLALNEVEFEDDITYNIYERILNR